MNNEEAAKPGIYTQIRDTSPSYQLGKAHERIAELEAVNERLRVAARNVVEQSDQVVAMAYSYSANAGNVIGPFKRAVRTLEDQI